MRPGQDSIEQIRCHEVSRALRKVNLSSEKARAIDLLSRSLVGRLLDGPISEVMARAEAEIPFRSRPGPEAHRGIERHGGADKPPGSKSDRQMREIGQSYIERESDFGGDQVSGKPALVGGETGGIGDRSVRS